MLFSSILPISLALSILQLAVASPIPSNTITVIGDVEALDFDIVDFGIDDAAQIIFSSHGATEDILDRMLAIAEARASSLDDEYVTYPALYTSAITEPAASLPPITFFSSIVGRIASTFSLSLDDEKSAKKNKPKSSKRRRRRAGGRHP